MLWRPAILAAPGSVSQLILRETPSQRCWCVSMSGKPAAETGLTSMAFRAMAAAPAETRKLRRDEGIVSSVIRDRGRRLRRHGEIRFSFKTLLHGRHGDA